MYGWKANFSNSIGAYVFEVRDVVSKTYGGVRLLEAVSEKMLGKNFDFYKCLVIHVTLSHLRSKETGIHLIVIPWAQVVCLI